MMRRATLLIGVTALLAGAAPAQQVPTLSYNPGHQEMVRFLVAAANASPFITIASAGNSVRGRQIPVVIVHDPNRRPMDLRRILVIARQHGNEPAGTTATLSFLRDLATGQARSLEAQLQRVCLIIVPMMNPDGAEADIRQNARRVDLNRDWQQRSQPETQAMERLFNLWRPHCVLDLHELHWRDRHGLNTIEAPEEGVVVSAIGAEARTLQRHITQRLETAGFPMRYSYWGEQANRNLAHRHYVLNHGTTALLFESERQNFRTPLPRRTQLHRIGLQTVIDYYHSDGFGSGVQLAARPPAANPPPRDDGAFPRVVIDTPGPGRGDAQLRDQQAAADETQVPPPTFGPPAPGTLRPSIEILSPSLAGAVRPQDDQVRFSVRLSGIQDLRFVAVSINGEPRYFGDKASFEFTWNVEDVATGRHVVLLRATRQNGTVVQREVFLNLVQP